MAPVQRTHAHRIARDQRPARALSHKREGEDAVEPVEERGRLVFAIQRVDHLAIGAGQEFVGLLQFLLQFAVVVDLAVDGQRQFAIGRTQRLRTTGRIDDGQALVHQDRALIDVHAAPVGAAMALALRKLERLPSQALQVVARLQAEDAEDGTHG